MNPFITRRRHAAVFGLLALLAFLPLAIWQTNLQPVHIETTEGSASIRFWANRGGVLFAGQCVVVGWQVENISAVLLNGQGRIGQGEEESCTRSGPPLLTVIFRDGSSHDYALPIAAAYLNPLVFLLLVVVILASGAAAFTVLGWPSLIAVATVVILGPILRALVNLDTDMTAHTTYARIILDGGDFRTLPPQFLYHLMIIGMSRLIPGLNLENAGFILLLAAYAVSAVGIYAYLRRTVADADIRPRLNLILSILTLSLMLIGPITFISGQYNPGGSLPIHPNLYHSPTLGLLRPFAIFLFLAVARLVTPITSAWSLKWAALLAALAVLATLAKPSYTIALLPAVAVFAACNLIRPGTLHWKLVLTGLILPAVTVLAWQYWFLYGTPEQITGIAAQVYAGERPRIVFSPFELHTVWWEVPWLWIGLEGLLSVLFPLTVYLAHFRRARHDAMLNLAWLTFLAAVAYGYLFIEIPAQGNANLTWSMQTALLILFLASTEFLVREYRETLLSERRLQPDWRLILCALLFAAHLIDRLTLLF